jgi:hypothetical protein
MRTGMTYVKSALMGIGVAVFFAVLYLIGLLVVASRNAPAGSGVISVDVNSLILHSVEFWIWTGVGFGLGFWWVVSRHRSAK